MKKIIYRELLKNYLRCHNYWHGQIQSRLSERLYDGLHPSNKFNTRWKFFAENLLKQDVVLDLACGTGTILKKLSPYIALGYGIELSERNLSLCRTPDCPDNINFELGNILNYDYQFLKAQIKYNVATYSHILEHIENVPELLNKVAASRILICVPSQENWRSIFLQDLGLEYRTDRNHFREYTREMLLRELAAASYQVKYMGFNQEGEIICSAYC